jgi:hypothetical protein
LFTESCWKGTKAQPKFEALLDISNIICGSLATSPPWFEIDIGKMGTNYLSLHANIPPI